MLSFQFLLENLWTSYCELVVLQLMQFDAFLVLTFLVCCTLLLCLQSSIW
jgi:hypothetical protein